MAHETRSEGDEEGRRGGREEEGWSEQRGERKDKDPENEPFARAMNGDTGTEAEELSRLSHLHFNLTRRGFGLLS